MARLYETHVDAIVQVDPQARLYEVHLDVIVDDGSSAGGNDPGTQGRVDVQGIEGVQGLEDVQGQDAIQGAPLPILRRRSG